MIDLIDRDQLLGIDVRIARLQEKINQMIGDIPPVTAEIICNSGSALAVSRAPANTITYSRSFRDLVQELHNCPNCGGSVDEEGVCRYCGSRVYRFGGV